MKHKNSNQGCKKRPYSDALIRLWPVNHSTFDRPRRTKTIPKQYWGKVVCCVEMPSGCYVDKKGVPKPLDPRSGKIVVEEHSDDHDDDSEDEDYEETDQDTNDKEDSDEEYTAPNISKSKSKNHKPIIPLPTQTTEMQTTKAQTQTQTTEAQTQTQAETIEAQTQTETTQAETETEKTQEQGNKDNSQINFNNGDNELNGPHTEICPNGFLKIKKIFVTIFVCSFFKFSFFVFILWVQNTTTEYKYYVKWNNQGCIESIRLDPEPNIVYTPLIKDEDDHMILYNETNDFRSENQDNNHYVSFSFASKSIYAVRFCEDGGGQSYHSYSSLFLMETFEDVIAFFKNGYYHWHQDSDCELCLQQDGSRRCFLRAKGTLAEQKWVECSDSHISYVLRYDVYNLKKRALRCDSDSSEAEI